MSTSSLSLRRPRVHTLTLPRPELLALVLVAALLDLWALDRNGFANEYYSAAVRSMTESWHAFIYGSFDAAGVMTVDKPPLALWIQALSAKVFGFSSWTMLVPQALMGVGTVVLAYDLTRRRFGRAAGFAAGLLLALTPITVAISRHNNPDALLVLCCVAAVWFAVRGLEDGRTRWLVLSGVCVGLGFEAKMAVALLVVPGIAAAWLWVAPRGRAAAARQLAAAGGAAAAVGLAWPVLVWLTPAATRRSSSERCAGSRTRRRAWACSWRICSRWRGSARSRRPRTARSTSPPWRATPPPTRASPRPTARSR
jgi:4-amino-4-deoxy-L-arabinose transferase-like glycosyltransferase